MGNAADASQHPPLPPIKDLWSAAITAAHAAASPMLAASVPPTLATVLVLGGLVVIAWGVVRVLHAFRHAFDARELLFDDHEGCSHGGGHRYRQPGRWMGGKHGGYVGAEGDLPLFPEDVHLQCSHWAETGGREYMEDRVAFSGRLQGRGGASYYAVFDGHGGALAAEFCREQMHRQLVELKALHRAPAAALKDAFLATDLEFTRALEGTERVDGTTALVSLVLGRKLYVANAGDSRAILVQRGARAIALSRDHKPSLPDEAKRITDAGGKVIFWGRWRVEGILAVSRAIGDRHLKPYVTAEPEVCEWALTDKDCFLVLMTDGITDVLSNEAVATMVMNNSHDLKWAARQLCEEAYLHGSLDNAAAIVVDLRDFGAHDCYHYYDCKEERAHQQQPPAAVVGGPPLVLPAAEEAAEGVVAKPGKEGEVEGEGMFGDRVDEGAVSLALMERQFRRVVTVRMRPGASGCGGVDSDTSGSGGGDGVGKGAQSEEVEDKHTDGKQLHQEERLPPLTAASTTTLSSRKRGGVGNLLQRRASRQGSAAGRENGWSPEKRGGRC